MSPTFAGVEEPGSALLRARAAKAAAVPPAERDADTADFVLRSEAMDAALALLRPTIDAPHTAEPRDVARGLALALEWMALCKPGVGNIHYDGFRRTLLAHSQPLLSGAAAEAPAGSMQLNFTAVMAMPELLQLAVGGGLWEDASLLTLLKAATACYALSRMEHPQESVALRLGLAMCGAVQRQLGEPSRAAAYAAELSALQAGEPAERRLTVNDLHRACLGERAAAAGNIHNNFSAGADAAAVAAFASGLRLPPEVLGPAHGALVEDVVLAGAEQQVALAPQHPGAHFAAARALWVATGKSKSRGQGDRDQGVVRGKRMIDHLQRALLLARLPPGRPYWLSRAAFELVGLLAFFAAAAPQQVSLEDLQAVTREVRAVSVSCESACAHLPQFVALLPNSCSSKCPFGHASALLPCILAHHCRHLRPLP
ncbi:hypothetical protein ABPG75_007555 [Micractinium tetrahymenae]